MSKPQQLTFPWSKHNTVSFDDFFFESSNNEIRMALESNEDLVMYGVKAVSYTHLTLPTSTLV